MSLKTIQKSFLGQDVKKNATIEFPYRSDQAQITGLPKANYANCRHDEHEKLSVIFDGDTVYVGRDDDMLHKICKVDSAFRTDHGWELTEKLIMDKIGELHNKKTEEIKSSVNSELERIAKKFSDLTKYVEKQTGYLPEGADTMIRTEMAQMVGEAVAKMIDPKTKLAKLKDLLINAFG